MFVNILRKGKSPVLEMLKRFTQKPSQGGVFGWPFHHDHQSSLKWKGGEFLNFAEVNVSFGQQHRT